MDYEYDHLSDGINKIRPELSRFIRQTEIGTDIGQRDPDWIKTAWLIESKLFNFPDSGEATHLELVKMAVGIRTLLENLEKSVISQSEAPLIRNIQNLSIADQA